MPSVFNREWASWVKPDGDSAERIQQVVYRCPSGALRVESPQGADLESPEPSNSVQLRRNGPLYLRGDLQIATSEDEILHRDTRISLCRCGASRNKPFCDNSHLRIGFASEEFKLGARQPILDVGALTITPTRNGPYELSGPVEIWAPGSQLVYRGEATRLCRCGASAEQPFCDDTHLQFDFEAEVW